MKNPGPLMSATEIIEQIRDLPREEQLKVAAFLRNLQRGQSTAESTVSLEFKTMANDIFATNADLFRKLASS